MEPHAALQPLCSGSLYSACCAYCSRTVNLTNQFFHMMNVSERSVHVHFLNNHRIRPSWNTRSGWMCVCVGARSQIVDSHTDPGLRPPPWAHAHSLRETQWDRSSFTWSSLSVTDRLLLNSGNSENNEFLWSQLIRDQRLSFLIRAEAAGGLYRSAVSVSASSLTCSHVLF